MKKEDIQKMSEEQIKNRLVEQGYINYPEIGWVKQDRIIECVRKGLLVEVDGEFMLTIEGARRTTWSYLLGNTNTITDKKMSRIHEAQVRKHEINTDEAFDL